MAARKKPEITQPELEPEPDTPAAVEEAPPADSFECGICHENVTSRPRLAPGPKGTCSPCGRSRAEIAELRNQSFTRDGTDDRAR